MSFCALEAQLKHALSVVAANLNVTFFTDKGFLTLDEFKGIVKEIEPDLPADELDKVVDEVDADGSGRIEFEEFLQVMVGE